MLDGVMNEDQGEEAIVVFTDYIVDRRAPNYIHWFTREGYRHCFVMVPTELGGTTVVNQSWNGLYIQTVAWDLASCALACHKAGFTVRRVSNIKNPRYTQRGLISCVSVIKSVLGIEDWRVITPYQLDRYLLANRMI